MGAYSSSQTTVSIVVFDSCTDSFYRFVYVAGQSRGSRGGSICGSDRPWEGPLSKNPKGLKEHENLNTPKAYRPGEFGGIRHLEIWTKLVKK